MNAKLVTVPELFLIASTRAVLGAGVALLLADRLTKDQRKAVGWTLLGIGAITTIPLARQVIFSNRASAEMDEAAITPPTEPAGYSA